MPKLPNFASKFENAKYYDKKIYIVFSFIIYYIINKWARN